MSIGEALAAARGEAGLTLSEISARTRIRETMLAAMEGDDFSLCGGHFYARGHIRSFARTVGVDPEPLVRQYDHEHGGPPGGEGPAQDFESKPISIPQRQRRRPNWSVAMAVVLLLVVAYGVFRLVSSDAPAGESGPVSQTSPSRSGVGVVSSASPASPKQPAGEPAPRPSESRTRVDGVQVNLQAKEDTWVSASGSEGDTLFRELLQKGDSAEFSDDKRIRMALGNAGGVELTVNGKKMGVPGGPGDTVQVAIHPNRVEKMS